MKPRVGVALPCKNEKATLRRVLTALRSQGPALVWIVVVDNGSTDGSLEIARELADEVVEAPSGSISDLRNLGAKKAAAAAGPLDAFAFVDADVEVGTGWLVAALDAMQDGADLVGNRMLAAPDDTWTARRWAALESRQAHDGSSVWSGHMVIRREIFEALGGFDGSLPTGEDADLSRRLLAAGHELRLVPGMVAIHHGFASTLRTFVRRESWHSRHPGWLPRMSVKSRTLVYLTAGWSALGAIAVLRSLVTRRSRPLARWSAFSLAGVPALGYLGTRTPAYAVQDGVLLALWAIIRVRRLPAEVGRRREAPAGDRDGGESR